MMAPAPVPSPSRRSPLRPPAAAPGDAETESSTGQYCSEVISGRVMMQRSRSIQPRARGNVVQSNEKDLIDDVKPDTQARKSHQRMKRFVRPDCGQTAAQPSPQEEPTQADATANWYATASGSFGRQTCTCRRKTRNAGNARCRSAPLHLLNGLASVARRALGRREHGACSIPRPCGWPVRQTSGYEQSRAR